MTRSQQSPRQAERFLAVFVGLTAAGLVYAFLRSSAFYLLIASLALLGWLYWRRRASHTGITMLLGAATFTAALAFVVVRPHLNLG